MLVILVLIAVAIGWWWFRSPGAHFMDGFAKLIDEAETPRKVSDFLRGRSLVRGRFRGRAVRLDVYEPTEDTGGRIVLAMATRAPNGAPWKNSTLTSRDATVSRATFDLEGRYELMLSLANGWLHATAMPLGFRFPGAFDEAKWRHTLVQMDVLAEWLEKIGSGSALRP